MADQKPSFFARLFLSWVAYFRTLFDADFAAGVVQLRGGALPPPSEPEPEEEPAPPPPRIERAPADAALQLLGILQREGRLIDFLMEDLTEADDEAVGAAARVVHEGCKKVLDEHFSVVPVRSEEEGTRITVEEGFDAAELRLAGNVVGDPPFTGELTHRGWRVEKVELPKLAEEHDVSVVAPAEVEL